MSKDKIPTAREIAQWIIESGASINQCEEKIKSYGKSYVEAALKAAKIQVREAFEGTSLLEENVENAYPLDNIK